MGSFASHPGSAAGPHAAGIGTFRRARVWTGLGPRHRKGPEAMSVVMLSRKRAAAPASGAKTASKAASNSLLIGEPDDSFEREADRLADELMSGSTVQPAWSLSKV